MNSVPRTFINSDLRRSRSDFLKDAKSNCLLIFERSQKSKHDKYISGEFIFLIYIFIYIYMGVS